MRAARIVLIAFGVVVGIVVLAMIGLMLFVDPNRYRGDIQRMVQQHTGRELTIQGKLELKVFPWLALSVHDVRLGNPPGYGAEPFATVQNASIGVKLLPLLGKRLEVSRVAIEGLSATLISRGEQNNWRDLSESKSAPAQPAAPSSAPPIASIAGVQIKDSRLLMRDEIKKSTTDLVLKQIHTGRLATSPSGSSVQDVKVEGTYLSRLDSEAKSAAATPLAFSLSTTGASYDAAKQTLAPATLDLKVGELAMTVTAAGDKPPGTVQGTVTIPKVSARKVLQAFAVAPPVTRDAQALSAFSFKTHDRMTPKQIQLGDLDMVLDDTRLQGVAAIEDRETNELSFDLRVNALNVDRYRAPPAKAPATAAPPKSAPPAAPTPLPLETLRKLNVHGTLRVGSATYAGLVFTDISTPLVARQGRLQLGPTQAHIYGGDYNGDIVLDARPATAQLTLSEHVRGTDIGAVVKAAYDSARLSGHADANVALTGAGNTDEALLQSLNGKIDALVKQGALNGIDIGYELQRAGSLLKQQLPPSHSGPARTVFNTLQANCTLDKGVLKNDDLRMETDFVKVHGKGTLVVATEALDYQVAAAVDQASAGSNAAGLDVLRGTEVPLSITGTLANPVVRPDLQALAKGQLGKEAKQKASELLKKNLGGLFGH